MQVQAAYRYSRHAICRLAQRGVSAEAMRILLEHGRTYNAGQGCFYVQLSRADLRRLAAEGAPEGTLRSLARLQAVVSNEGEVVTCYHASARRLVSSRRRPSFKYH